MSAAGTPSRIVTVFGEQLDLYKPREADRFLAHMVTYGAAAACEWEKEFLLAQRIVSQATYDATHSPEDRFEAWADGMTELDQGDRDDD
jgi:hypothetical protein